MSAIQFAMQHFVDGRTRGRVEAIGPLYQEVGDDRPPTYFAIIKIKRDRRLEPWYDYGQDIILSSDLQAGDEVVLITRESNRVEWVLDDKPASGIPENIITAEQVYAERGKSAEILQTERGQRTFRRRTLESVEGPNAGIR
jgi:hypothetical protein